MVSKKGTILGKQVYILVFLILSLFVLFYGIRLAKKTAQLQSAINPLENEVFKLGYRLKSACGILKWGKTFSPILSYAQIECNEECKDYFAGKKKFGHKIVSIFKKLNLKESIYYRGVESYHTTRCLGVQPHWGYNELKNFAPSCAQVCGWFLLRYKVCGGPAEVQIGALGAMTPCLSISDSYFLP